jgi:hypothetical protein
VLPHHRQPPTGPWRGARGLRAALFGGGLLVAGLVVAGCGEDQTGQPGVAEVDFTPRLIVTVDDGGMRATVGPKGEGDQAVSADPARLPAGSVIEVRFEGSGEHRVVGHLWAPGEARPDLNDREVATPSPLLDTGVQRPGDDVTVVVSDPGTLELTEHGDDDPELRVEITPRSTS